MMLGFSVKALEADMFRLLPLIAVLNQFFCGDLHELD